MPLQPRSIALVALVALAVVVTYERIAPGLGVRRRPAAPPSIFGRIA